MKTALPLLLVAILAPVLPVSCESTLTSNSRGTVAEGAWMAKLPSGARRVEIDGVTYYQKGPDFFVRRSGRFVAVKSPLSTLSAKQAITQPEGRTSALAMPNRY